MIRSIEESLLRAIKKDDAKAFGALMEQTQLGGACRLGRFPLLSLMYLYRSRKLISIYEEKFLNAATYKELGEPMEISAKFASKAGKCLRLYWSETVSPLEMLLILDKTSRLKRIFPTVKTVTSSVKGRLKTIYYIKYSLSVKYEGSGIVLEKRPLSHREKKNIAVACLCIILAVAVIVGAPVATVSLMPKPIEGEATKLSHIDFSSSKVYTLKRDIALPKNYSVDKMNCTIVGEGNKLIFGKGASIGEFNGKLSDMTIESSGGALFKTVAENAVIENLTVNVNADIDSKEGGAFVALTNYGTIQNIKVNVSGKLSASAPSAQVSDELTFGGIVANNISKYVAASQKVYNGNIKNCTVDYAQFELSGEASANAAFGGVAGVNDAYVRDCTVTGSIKSDTFDIAGICSVNNGLLSGNVNEAELSQTSSDTGWNPIVCGIVMNNAYAVEKCVNKGKLSSASNCEKFEVEENTDPSAAASGIAYISRSSRSSTFIKDCENYGNIDIRAEYRNVYGAGICLSSNGTIVNSKNAGAINVKSSAGFEINVGGIAALAYGDMNKCVNEGAISAEGGGEVYAGGIAAQTVSMLSYCISGGDISVIGKDVYVGGIFGMSDVTSYGNYVYFGSADYCISQCKISAASTDGGPVYAGGIAGYVKEERFESTSSVQYFGGCVTNSYFIGETASDISYFGSIVGVCGAKIYESNSFGSGEDLYNNFDGNYYSDAFSNAFGATVTNGDEFVAVEDKGATGASIEQIKNSVGYKLILSKFEN